MTAPRPIRAAVSRAFGAPPALEEVRLAPPGPGEVEVALAATAICHSDISLIEGAWGGDLPAVFGHEAAGHVAALGPGTEAPAPGTPVIVTLIRSCGGCAFCAEGRAVRCTAPRPGLKGPLTLADGAPLSQGLACAAFAERVVVHRSQIAPLPAHIDMAAASLLACGAITGLGAAINTARIRPGEAVVVIGAGGVGLNAIQGARIAGAARILAVDTQPAKLEAAVEFGATDVMQAGKAEPWRRARRLMGRAADAVLVTVGSAGAYAEAPRYLAPGGRMVAVGMPPTGAEAAYEPVELAARGQVFLGSLMGDVVLARDIPWMLDLHAQGRLKLDELVSGRWRPDEIAAAIADTRAGAARRNVILWR